MIFIFRYHSDYALGMLLLGMLRAIVTRHFCQYFLCDEYAVTTPFLFRTNCEYYRC